MRAKPFMLQPSVLLLTLATSCADDVETRAADEDTGSGDSSSCGAECPELCDNAFDDNQDGSIDCDDGACSEDHICTSAGCVDWELGDQIGFDLVQFTTVDEGDDTQGTCGGAGAEDKTIKWRAPNAGTWAINTAGSSYDTLIYVRVDSCVGEEIECNDDDSELGDSQVFVDLQANQVVYIFIDGQSSEAGDFQLNIHQEE